MFKLNRNIDFDSYTLVVPSVSVGNVGQFAADLLISSLDMQKIGTIWDPAIVPVIGGDPYNDTKELMISCELYANEDRKIAVVQLRSPLITNETQSFLSKFVGYFKKYSIKQIIVLSSSFASEKHTVLSVQYRYFKNDSLNVENTLKNIEWIDYSKEHDGNLVVHGGGFAKKLFDVCTENKMPCLVLFKYCSEGDNQPDAVDMIKYLNKWLKLFRESEGSIDIKFPSSWKLFFGSPPPREMF